MAQFTALRGIYKPYHHAVYNRKYVIFS